VSRYVDAERDRFGVEPICRVLEVPTSTYYAARTRPPSRRETEDERLLREIRRVYVANYSVYGPRRVWRQLAREGIVVGRCRVERLMARAGMVGVLRGKRWRTTTGDPSSVRPADLVDRNFSAARPNELWLADFTYVATWEGVVYAAFVMDVFSRRIVGWQLADHMRTDLVLDALEMAVWQRDLSIGDLVHHSDQGSQYVSFRYTERLQEAGITPSVGSAGDAYDNAMCEALMGSFKAELIKRRRWKTRTDAELAIVEWIGWYNERRLHSSILDLPPAEFEAIWTALGAFGAPSPENRPPESPESPASNEDGMNHWADPSAFASSASTSADDKIATLIPCRLEEEGQPEKIEEQELLSAR
jgi:putative transposase